MKKSVLITLSFSALLIALLIFLTGCYHRGGQNPDQRMKFVIGYAAGELQLDDSQKAELEVIAGEVRDKMKELHGDREQDRAKVIGMIRNGEITEESVNDLIDEKLAAFEKVRPFFVEKIVEAYSLLNEEQRRKAADLIEKHKSGEGCPGPGRF